MLKQTKHRRIRQIVTKRKQKILFLVLYFLFWSLSYLVRIDGIRKFKSKIHRSSDFDLIKSKENALAKKVNTFRIDLFFVLFLVHF